PTHSIFGRVVQDALSLPTRRPTFPGSFRWEGSISFDTHNPLEIYLPDKSKWVLFDVDYAFVARWLGAQELCSFVRAHASPYDTGYPDAYVFRALDIHEAPRAFLAIPDPSSGGGKLISSTPVAYAWRDQFRYFYSGVAYWGDTAGFQMPTGTEFL